MSPERREEARRRLQAGESPSIIAGEYGITPASAWRLARRKTPRWTWMASVPDSMADAIARDYAADVPVTEIASAHGIPTHTVYSILRDRYGPAHQSPTSEQVATIITMRERGARYSDIVSAVGLSEPTIWAILRNAGLARTRQDRERNA